MRGLDEECDDGNNVNDDGCDQNCTFTRCGNGIMAGLEQCDDGNNTDGDLCDGDCTLTGCGNHIVTYGEDCDEGVLNSDTGGCLLNCRLAECGDGLVQEGVEQCDEGPENSNDGKCLTDCTKAACGDGRVQTEAEANEDVEACDDGNNDDCGTCSEGCQEIWKHAEGSIAISASLSSPVVSGEKFTLTGLDSQAFTFEYVVDDDLPSSNTIPISLTMARAQNSGMVASLTVIAIANPQINRFLRIAASLNGSSVKLVHELPGMGGNHVIDFEPETNGHLIVSGMDGGTGQGLCGRNIGCKSNADCLSNDCHDKHCR